MITNLYTIYDRKAKTYNRPFHQLNDDIALRTATDLLSSTPELKAHPEDYALFCIGHYDDNTAIMQQNSELKHIINFHEIINPDVPFTEELHQIKEAL